MTDHHWPVIRQQAIDTFGGELPHAHTEQAIIDVFTEHPTIVLRLIDELANATVRSRWAVLAKRLEQALNAPDVTATDEPDRDKRIRQAEAWIRIAGIHCDRWADIHDELFGNVGGPEKTGPLLKPWADDQALEARMERLWAEQRPRGEQVEREAIERGLRYIEHRNTMRTQPRTTHPPDGLTPVSDGDCDDCHTEGSRYAYATLNLCAHCAHLRGRVLTGSRA